MIKNTDKKGLEFSFKVLFAIILGAFILFLAIYAATRLIPSQSSGTSAALAKEIGVLLNPLETGFESGRTSAIFTNTETRIYNDCNNFSDFGSQLIQVSQKTFNKWQAPGVQIEFQNKYIFSESYEEGTIFNIFSKPLEMPFKIADLVFLSSAEKSYCFVNPPASIKDEIEQLNQSNIRTENCGIVPAKVRVCFSPGSDCDVNVGYNAGWVEKNNTRVYFAGNTLMYAAIFSSSKIYECQAQRLALRAEELASIYHKKQGLVGSQGCLSNLDISSFAQSLGSYDDSSDLGALYSQAVLIDNENSISLCRMW